MWNVRMAISLYNINTIHFKTFDTCFTCIRKNVQHYLIIQFITALKQSTPPNN